MNAGMMIEKQILEDSDTRIDRMQEYLLWGWVVMRPVRIYMHKELRTLGW